MLGWIILTEEREPSIRRERAGRDTRRVAAWGVFS